GPGCAWTGGTSETVYDNQNGYSAPLPSYTVLFQTAASLPIIFALSLKNNSGIPSNALALVQTAIQQSFSGADGGARARIGAYIFSGRYYTNLLALGPWMEILSLYLGSPLVCAAV